MYNNHRCVKLCCDHKIYKKNIISHIFSSFFLFWKKLPIVVVHDVCPSVRPSVQIISFRGNLISHRPIDFKIGLNVRSEVVHVRKTWLFEILIASCKFLQFMLQLLQLIIYFAVFTDNYRSSLSQLQLVAKWMHNKGSSLWTIQSTRDTISIHNDYVRKSIVTL